MWKLKNDISNENDNITKTNENENMEEITINNTGNSEEEK